MYYRYEIKQKTEPETEWRGVFSIFDPDQRRFWGRRLYEPKWYLEHEDEPSRCWFTEAGYARHYEVMDSMVQEYLSCYLDYEMRLLVVDTLQNLVMKGKIQCIELLEC